MYGDVEKKVYEEFIKPITFSDNGVIKIQKNDFDKIKLFPTERNFILHILNDKKIKVVGEHIKREERSKFVRDNNYGSIKTNELEKIDDPYFSNLEYSESNEKIYEDYSKLDEYLETRFIPAYTLVKKRVNKKGEEEFYQSISFNHISALRLNEDEFNHVMNYLKEKNIRVAGTASTIDGEFENYDYITNYKSSALPPSVNKSINLEKFIRYKKTNDPALREEIIKDNMRLVPYVACRYASSTKIDQKELESYGYEGLILAVDNFDENFANTFSTFAISYIRGFILRGINQYFLGKTDNRYYDYIKAISTVEKENNMKISENPSLVDDVIELLIATGKINDNNESKNTVRSKIITLSIGNESFNYEDYNDEIYSEGQFVDSHDIEDILINDMYKKTINDALETIAPKEKKIICMRYGLDGEKPKTILETSKELNVTPYNIIKTEKKGLEKLRNRLSKLNELEQDLDTDTHSKSFWFFH